MKMTRNCHHMDKFLEEATKNGAKMQVEIKQFRRKRNENSEDNR